MKTVSILIPVYNVSNFIRRCAESVFGQTYNQLDIIFVDDCSPDNSVQVVKDTLERFPHRKNQVRIVRHEVNRGLAAARNTAVETAIGEYIVHVDSDDFIDKTLVERCVETMESMGADAVMYGINHVFPDKIVQKHVHIPISKDDFVRLLLSRQSHFYIWSGMYKSNLYKLNHIHAIEGINHGEDYTVTPRLLYHAKKVVALDIPLYNYIHYNENSYTNTFSRYSAESHLKILSMLRQYFLERGENGFIDAIDQGETMLKSSLFLKWALKENANEHLEFIRKEYKANNRNIPLSKKIILYLSDYPIILKVYCRLGFKLKQFFKH